MNAFELALKYYPVLWDENRIKALLNAGKIIQSIKDFAFLREAVTVAQPHRGHRPLNHSN